MINQQATVAQRTDQQIAERKAKWFWVSLVVALLGLQLVIGGVAIKLATGDASAAIVPNYHQAALNWDQIHSERTAAKRLGWTVDLDVSSVADGRGMRAVQVSIADADGKPIDDLQVSADIYHHARAAEVQTVDMQPVGDAEYQVLAPMERSGLWQVDLNIRHDDQRITVQRTLERD
ncbi:FixH family protein [Rosistilla oblonga]|uniref:FixH family protein n=1 Tax=Rosistilla oblonga TaxID=2527990 RepID=UPI003A9794F5